MFERFTDDARAVVKEAQIEARSLNHRHIGTEHLLLGILAQADRMPARLLARHGLDHAAAVTAVRDLLQAEHGLDADLLGHIGIDLDAVREKVEATFGPGALDRPPGSPIGPVTGHIPFTRRAKKALELSLREAIALKHNYIGTGHILLGILREGEGLAAKVIANAGIGSATLREEVKAQIPPTARG